MTPGSARDPAVDALLTAETLLGQLKALLIRLTSLMPSDVSGAIGEAQSLYPELWASLDRAHRLLRDRGIVVPGYDETRARQPAHMLGVDVTVHERSDIAEATSWAVFLAGGAEFAAVTTAAFDAVMSVGAKKGDVNQGGLRDARTAIDALQSAMSEVDWKQIRRNEAREAAAAAEGLSRAGHKKLLFGGIGLAVAVAIGVGIVVLLNSSRPPTKEEIAAREHAAFRDAQEEIRELNSILKQTPCDTQAAERRVSLFVGNNQSRTARRLAKNFLEQCGDNASLRAVVDDLNAPRPPTP